MKYSCSQVYRKASALPQLRFQHQQLASFAGLVILQQFFARIRLAKRLRACFRGLSRGIYRPATLFVQLVLHLLLGFRELRHLEHYRDDPLIQRLLAIASLPSASTLSHMLSRMTPRGVERLRALLRSMVLERLAPCRPARVTLDFDGSVQAARRHAEGTAVGYNPKRKGSRSYYPLFCTVAQTSQVLDLNHRPRNVHDSNGAGRFILDCVAAVRAALPGVCIEVRLDSAFFSDEIESGVQEAGVEFTISVPFERFAELKRLIEECRRWRRMDGQTWYD